MGDSLSHNMSSAASWVDERLPLHLLTGFLGSGKTSLLRRLLGNPAFADTAVVINEFGEIGLDHLLVREVADGTILLPSGCLCCEVRDDLISTLEDLLHGSHQGGQPAFSRIIVETTGLADPAPIMQAVMSNIRLCNSLRTGNIITVVDALCGHDTIKHFDQAVGQVALADQVVITKSDLVDPWHLEALRRHITQINPTVTHTIATPDKDSEIAKLFLAQNDWLSQHAKLSNLENRLHHNADIRSFCVRLNKKIPWAAFSEWLELLLMARGRSILRVKGLVPIIGETRPLVIHGVQHVVHPPQYLPEWPDGKEEGWLIFIARDLTKRAIERSLSQNFFEIMENRFEDVKADSA